MGLISLLIVLPLIAAVVLALLPRGNDRLVRWFALAAVLAERNEPEQAREVLVESLEQRGTDGLGDHDRYVLGRIAESHASTRIFVMERLATARIVSVSVALLFAGFGSVVPAATPTVAMFASVPEALAVRVVLAMNVALPPESRVTVPVRLLPVPAVVQLEPAVAVQVQVPTVSADGKVSATAAPVAVFGPALATTMV